jgi:hypothetical protein
MQCTQCGSDNVQRLSIIYQSGTQHISTTSTTFGAGGGTGFGVGSATTSTSGTSQSYLAVKAAPPLKKSYRSILLLIPGIGVAGLAESILPLLVLAAIAALRCYHSFRYNKGVYPGLRATWLKSWHCNKCGIIYSE